MQVASVQAEQFVGKMFGDYDIERLIGYGQWNAVYQAQLRSPRRPVLLTIFLLPETFSSQARTRFLERLYREGAALLTLQHPHILPLLDIREYMGYPYLITPFVSGNSLANVLRQQGRFTPAQTLELLKPLAEALDYAHGRGISHGALSLAHLLIDKTQTLRVTSFGLNRLGALQGIEEGGHSYSHLLSITETPLSALEYIAPEVVTGSPANARSDIYSTGLLLFELLSGSLPFRGTNLLDIAIQHVQQTVPSLNAAVPEALDLVVHQAVKRDPAQRFQSIGGVVRGFERVLQVLNAASVSSNRQVSAYDLSSTLPPTVDWAVEDIENPRPWELSPASKEMRAIIAQDQVAPQVSRELQNASVDPFALWSNTASARAAGPGAPTFVGGMPAQSQPLQQGKGPRKGRRQVVALLATGSVVAAGALAFSGVSLAQIFQKQAHPAPTAAQPMKKAPLAAGKAPTPTKATQATAPQATKAVQPTPVATKPPQNTGTVVGASSLAVNGTTNFTNKADGMPSLLIHLPNGNFVAYELACTHEGVIVNYNTMTQHLVCPRHGAIFDANQAGKVLQGPADQPLKAVPIHVNADGTITLA